jgi:cytidylate kinase
MAVITIAGTKGSRAYEAGNGVADELGIDYVDHEILVDSARKLGVHIDTMVERDERCRGFGERLAGIMRSFLEQSAAAGAVDPMTGGPGLDVLLARNYGELNASSGLDDRLYIEALTAVIRALGRRGRVVIVGRGSQAILRGQPGTLHVHISAPLAWRVNTVVEREGLSVEEARRSIEEFDRQRAAFHKKFFKVDVNDPSLYDLGLNTETLGVERAVKAIVAAAPESTPRDVARRDAARVGST